MMITKNNNSLFFNFSFSINFLYCLCIAILNIKIIFKTSYITITNYYITNYFI